MGYGFGNRIAVGRRAITAQAQVEQVIWKVAIFGAGTASSNGEYVWDGTTQSNGKNQYNNGNNAIYFGDFGSGYNEWGLYDDAIGDNAYKSVNLINWTIIEGSSSLPAPSSALSYSQTSEIISITIANGGTTGVNGVYAWDNETLDSDKPVLFGPFVSQQNNIIFFTGDSWYLTGWNGVEFVSLYGASTADLFLGFDSVLEGSAPTPDITSASYSA